MSMNYQIRKFYRIKILTMVITIVLLEILGFQGLLKNLIVPISKLKKRKVFIDYIKSLLGRSLKYKKSKKFFFLLEIMIAILLATIFI